MICKYMISVLIGNKNKRRGELKYMKNIVLGVLMGIVAIIVAFYLYLLITA